jgi:tRNA 2-thiouridine synthesizing protein A
VPAACAEDEKGVEVGAPSDFLKVHCTDPLFVTDIPNLIRETRDAVEIAQRYECQIVFLMQKLNDPIGKA